MVKQHKAHGQPRCTVAPESAGPMTAKGRMRPAFRAEPTGSETAKGPVNGAPIINHNSRQGRRPRNCQWGSRAAKGEMRPAFRAEPTGKGPMGDRERARGGRGPRKERQGRLGGRMERRPGPRTAPKAAAPPAAPSQNDNNDNNINLYYYQNINYDEKFIITAAPSQNDENNNGIHLSSLYRQSLRPQDRSILLPGI